MAETEQLTAELQREREARAILEARLERAEARLRGMERLQREEARGDLDVIRVQQQLWGMDEARPAPAAGPVLNTWLVEARMSAIDVGVQTPTAHVRPQPVPLMEPVVFTSAPQENATIYVKRGDEEVSRLKRELGEARANEIRAIERLRELERRVAEVDAQAAALRAAQAERQAPPLPWTESVLERRQTSGDVSPTPEPQAAAEKHSEESEPWPISDALAVPELERRVQPELPDSERVVEEAPEEPTWQSAETEVALRTFARTLQDRPEAPDLEEEAPPPAAPEIDAGKLEPPEAPTQAPSVEEPLEAEAFDHSAFTEVVQAWSAREAEKVVTPPEDLAAEEEEEGPGTPGGPRPHHRTEAMVEALQRFIGKKPE